MAITAYFVDSSLDVLFCDDPDFGFHVENGHLQFYTEKDYTLKMDDWNDIYMQFELPEILVELWI